METRKTRGIKADTKFQIESADSDSTDYESPDDIRKSKIRDCNKEFARRMTILQTWSQHWSDYTTREGEAYPQKEAKNIIKKAKKISCPIPSCRKTFTTVGGLRYHYARCNIERCFKCKVCEPTSEHKTRGDLLRHMVRAHYNDLPELDPEQKDIAQSYFISTGKSDRSKVRKSQTDSEPALSCNSTIKLYGELIGKTFAKESSDHHPFKDWHPFCRDWELLTYEIDRRRYYPPEKESPHFKMSGSPGWNMIDTGNSSILLYGDKNSQKSLIFFTGGASTSSAWLPKPVHHKSSSGTPDVIAISVNCCSMERNFSYKECKDLIGCIQFWSTDLAKTNPRVIQNDTKASMSFMVGHNYGYIFDMNWCPLGTSWEPDRQLINQVSNDTRSRMGLLALACGDGQVRILSVPHADNISPRTLNKRSYDPIEAVPIYRVRPIATLMPPGVGPSTDYQQPACTAIHWCISDNQRLIAAGYSNGSVALFDLANYSPILYTSTEEQRHVYQPLRTWFAHGLPISGIAISSKSLARTTVITGSRDKQVKMWNLTDLSSCLTSERAPITKLFWDYRLRGVVTSTESAFTSFQNRVSYRFPTFDGFSSATVSTHRATVWGLTGSMITSALATSDDAGEVFVCPLGRPSQKRDRNHLNTHSLYSLVPRIIDYRQPEASNTDYNGILQASNSSMNSSYLFKDTDQQQITITSPTILSDATKEENISLREDVDFDDDNQVIDDYSFAERSVANKPAQFLLPIDHPAVETYGDFKRNFGLEFVNYETKIPTRKDQKMPKSCHRAADTASIYCDRVCDYPFCSIKHVVWSPNLDSFSSLLSVSHIGLCRLDNVEIIEQVYKGYIETLCNSWNSPNCS